MDRERLQQITKQLADDGKIIEAGWVGLRILAIPPNASDIQVDEMRMAFMAGAQHLFSSMMNIMDPGNNETPGDMRRMEFIDKELRVFAKEMAQRLKARHGRPDA